MISLGQIQSTVKFMFEMYSVLKKNFYLNSNVFLKNLLNFGFLVFPGNKKSNSRPTFSHVSNWLGHLLIQREQMPQSPSLSAF